MTEQKVEVLEVVPFNNDMTKDQMIEHLRDVHGITGRMKVTKDALIEYHESIHDVLDRAESDPDLYYSGKDDRTVIRSRKDHYIRVRYPLIEHVHEAVSISDIQKEQIEAAKSGGRLSDKPLTASERKVLTELVNNDFKGTEQEIRSMAADSLAAELDHIKSQHSANKDAEQWFTAEFDRIMQEAQTKVAGMIRDMAKQGVTVIGYGVGNSSVYNRAFTYEKYDSEVRRAKEENAQMLNRALITLERQRLTAMHRILMSGVTEEAAALLDTVPTAQSMMIEAAAQQAAKQIKS